MLRDYSLRGFLVGSVATALYVTNYTVAAAIWGLFGVVFLALAIVWETMDRRQADHRPQPEDTGPTAPRRRPHRAPQLPRREPRAQEEHGDRTDD